MSSFRVRGPRSSAFVIAFALASSLSSCVFAVGGQARERESIRTAGLDEASDAPAESAKQDDPAASAAKERAKARKAEKRAFDLELARLELALEELDQQNSTAEAQRKLDEARKSLDEAQMALDVQVQRAGPRELSEAQLSLDRATQRREEAELELREMEATYAKDQFAKDTKELVLSRHRKQLEFATRELEHARMRFEDKKNVELPKDQRDAERKLREARASLNDAEIALRRSNSKAEIALRRSRNKVRELEQSEDDDEGGKKGGA